MSEVKTLGQFLIEKQANFPYANGELFRLLRDIGIASKIVNREVNKAGLMDILGSAGNTNIQGKNQQKLDVYANEKFISALQSEGECCILASEENEDIIRIDSAVSKGAKYAVATDLLDGSSNIDVNHQCTPVFAGSRDTVLLAEHFMKEAGVLSVKDAEPIYTSNCLKNDQ